MKAIFKRELKSSFSGVMGWLMVAFPVLVCSIYLWAQNLIGASPDFSYTVYCTTFSFLIYVPILTMRSFAEERHSRTDQLLLTSPASLTEIVLGKFLALLCVFAIALTVIGVMPLILSLYGTLDFPRIYGTLLCYLFLGAACIALGLFVSAQTESQLVAAIVTFGILLVCYLMGSIQGMISGGSLAALLVFLLVFLVAGVLAGVWGRSLLLGILVAALPGLGMAVVFFLRGGWLASAFTKLLEAFDLFAPFVRFVYGIFDLTALVYYLSLAVLMLFLTVQTLDRRRWN